MNWENFVDSDVSEITYPETEINSKSIRGKNKKGRMISIDDTEITLPMNYF